MVKGDASKYRKSIKGKMTDKQNKRYRELLSRETKGYDKALEKIGES